MWVASKVMFQGKFTSLNASIREIEKLKMNDLSIISSS